MSIRMTNNAIQSFNFGKSVASLRVNEVPRLINFGKSKVSILNCRPYENTESGKRPIQKPQQELKPKEQTKTINNVSVSDEIRRQVDKQVDNMMIDEAKKQLQGLVADTSTATEASPAISSVEQLKPEVSSKNALKILAEKEQEEEYNPLSPEKRLAFRKFISGLISMVDEEFRKKKEKKKRKGIMLQRIVHYVQDKAAMQNREQAINSAIRSISRRNNMKGLALVTGNEIAEQIPEHPPITFISRIRFQFMRLLLPELFGDGSYDAVRDNVRKLDKMPADRATQEVAKIIQRFPAVEQAEAVNAPSVSMEDVQRVFQTNTPRLAV